MKKNLTDEDYDDGYFTDEELEKAVFKPFKEVDPAFYAAWQAGEVKVQGRPMLPNKKVPISLRVEPWLLEAMKASGKNWQQKARDALSKTFL